ncbi:SRPBCC family protein [Mycobacterium sp. Aquia_213]|uniref:SRPBCC family protein n=1 Tax=Mycobacterium sp. Aquia_213 TaxID=2991728 RepID=UPI0022718D51|nr:SRPBCC family protein [Mycobacterium sp. Aquia_213]WAC93058.1 SRPBCC family protein [Mycobacterium sp. Aquia_213]
MTVLHKGETLSASVELRASAEEVYALIANVTRIPEWSPETRRAQWLGPDSFRAWNHRRLGRWRTDANVVDAVVGQRFSFVVQVLGGDWTQWTYLIEPGSAAGTTRLTEMFEMCVELPFSVLLFERLALLVWDRRTDLQRNLEISLDRIRTILEAGVKA